MTAPPAGAPIEAGRRCITEAFKKTFRCSFTVL
jgi:hypothetical protein